MASAVPANTPDHPVHEVPEQAGGYSRGRFDSSVVDKARAAAGMDRRGIDRRGIDRRGMEPREIDRRGMDRKGAEAALPEPAGEAPPSTAAAGSADSGTAFTEATVGDPADKEAVTLDDAAGSMARAPGWFPTAMVFTTVSVVTSILSRVLSTSLR